MEKQEGSPSTEAPEDNKYRRTNTDLVREFITAFDANMDHDLALKLVVEEAMEVREAFAHLLKELADFEYITTYSGVAGMPKGFGGSFGREVTSELREKPLSLVMSAARIAEAMNKVVPADVQQTVFERVHASNMSKLGDDGKPVRREDGKILKSKNYVEPYLLDLV